MEEDYVDFDFSFQPQDLVVRRLLAVSVLCVSTLLVQAQETFTGQWLLEFNPAPYACLSDAAPPVRRRRQA